MANTQYDPARKYELMYKIINIGNLIESLPLNIKIKSTMKGLFKIARNIVSDAFHTLLRKMIDNF
jgi:hypothetical protein